MTFALLLKGGKLIDPAIGIHAFKDIAFDDGKVVAVENDLPDSMAAKTIDCTGRIVAPGMIDIHAHIFPESSHYGIEADPNCVAKGVTTVVDAGSAGADNFSEFREKVIERSITRIFAYLHISSTGLARRDIGELSNVKNLEVQKTIDTINRNREVILGVKIRLSKKFVNEALGIRALYLAREVADATGLSMMVHPPSAWFNSIDEILAVMHKGDILTHCFHNKKCGILNANGNVLESVWEALNRGIVFDVGHGRGSFDWDVAACALELGFQPQTISSDLHIYNKNGPVYDLATTVSKFLTLGLSVYQVIDKVTAAPAQILGMSHELGTLKVGASGDCTVFEIQNGNFKFSDSNQQVRIGKQRLMPKLVVQKGMLYQTS